MNKEERMIIRLSADEKAGFERAAEFSGLGLSTWARQVMKAAAIKQYKEVGEKLTFLNSLKK
ncbi:MAG: hypothetical protein SH818_13210 [Saprospiraceae bacterium]|nr:hypothetical protein [Saprospiraceae bacterium]